MRGKISFYDVTNDQMLSTLGYVSYDQEYTKVSNTALDGTTYLQIIGKPNKKIKVEGMIVAEGKRSALENAEATGALILLQSDLLTTYARIDELGDFSKIDYGHYSVDVQLYEEADDAGT